MRQFAWALVCALVAVAPTSGFGQQLVPVAPPVAPPAAPLVFVGQPGQLWGLPDDGNYQAPKSDGPVAVLFDEALDPLLSALNNDGSGYAGTAVREDRDAFAGVEAVRILPRQKYRSGLPGWNFKIVENPKNAGEYRYVRFAWKKLGGTGVMVQFYDPNGSKWHRYHAGKNVLGWQPSTQLGPDVPTDWELVTRDLFKDFGAATITGFSLTAFDGTAALFDHMLLGRTVADLDRATDAALGRTKPATALTDKERDKLWTDLISHDRIKAAAALRALLATAPDQVGFIGERLRDTTVSPGLSARIQKLLADLDADEFDVRDGATDELVKIGGPAIDAVRALTTSAPSDEVSYRARVILRKLNAHTTPVSEAGRMARVVRVLERAGTADARVLVSKLAEGEFGFAAAPEAKAAATRMAKKPQ